MASNTTFMGNYTFGDNGVIIPDTSDVLETVQNEYRAALGQDLSLEESTPQGRLIDTETTARIATLRFNAQIANILINIASSSGSALDAWGANFDIPRNGATASRVPVLVTGVIDTVISAGSQASTADGSIWLAESEIIIGDDGTGTGTFICSKTGAISLGLNELTTIVSGSTTGINGWETITNTAVAELGAAKESDARYKQRILTSLFTGTALFGNYASACYKVDNVKDIFTYDNPYGAALQLDNILIPAHSVFVCVDGGNSEDVAYALYEIKSAGCGWCGNTTVTVTDKTYGTKNTVTYFVPEDISCKLAINATNLNNSDANLAETIQNIIVNYFNGDYADIGYNKLGIRALLAPFTIASLLNSQVTGVNFNSIEVGLTVPAAHAVASIFKASVTSGITWASVETETFKTKITSNGTYNFEYNGSEWTLNNQNVILTDYGITVTGNPITGDIISILYADGNLSQSPLMLFATEKASITTENITVNING